jgi:hypothetical protein
VPGGNGSTSSRTTEPRTSAAAPVTVLSISKASRSCHWLRLCRQNVGATTSSCSSISRMSAYASDTSSVSAASNVSSLSASHTSSWSHSAIASASAGASASARSKFR